MPIDLNHTIVHVRDRHASAAFLADILGLTVGEPYGPFIPVQTHNGVTLDFMDAGPGTISPQHYAFLLSEQEFDEVHGRLVGAGVRYYADPYHRQPDRINTNDGGRGLYFEDPDGHNLEIITRPYGSGG
jgi:catechol 2,3-dioxygenase-like lactoylglutathione lyase family enzyme